MNELDKNNISGKTIVVLEYAKVYPEEYYIKKRGRKKSVTSYHLDYDNPIKANKAEVTYVHTGRECIDIDSTKMQTKVFYKLENGTTGSQVIDPSLKFTEILPDVYLYNKHLHLVDKIKELLNA